MLNLKFNKKIISLYSQTYFIADIASNHGGDLRVAKQLIYDAAEAGANAAKFSSRAASPNPSTMTSAPCAMLCTAALNS
jgi:sialic acid synthase SpsE